MSGFTAEKSFTREFDGDTVNYVLKAPTVKTMQKMAPFINQAQQGDATFAVSMEHLGALSNVLDESVVALFEGLTDANGGIVTLDTAINTLYFSPLIQDMLKDLFSLTAMGDSEVKKQDDM